MKVRKIFLIGIFMMLLSACAPSTPDPITVNIDMTEYQFEPNEIELQVGQEVTLILTNSGELDHELMIGNAVEYEDGIPTSYLFDFFREGGVTPEVTGGGMLMSHNEEGHDDGDMAMDDEHSDDEMAEDDHEDEDMAMEDDEHAEDEDMAMEDDDHSDDEGALMVMVPVGADTTTVTFTVTEDMAGTWEMGCFELDGVHYNSGMVGTVTVVP